MGSNPAAPTNFFLHSDISSGCLACVSGGIFFPMFLIILLPMHTASVQNDRSGYAYRYGE